MEMDSCVLPACLKITEHENNPIAFIHLTFIGKRTNISNYLMFGKSVQWTFSFCGYDI